MGYSGPGNYIVSNFKSEVWSNLNEPYAPINIGVQDTCMPDLDSVRYFNVTKADFILYKREGISTNFIACRLEYEQYREIQVFLINFNNTENINGAYPPIIMVGNLMATINDIGNLFYNSSNQYALTMYQYWGRVNFYDLHIEQSDALYQYTILCLDVPHIVMKNVTLYNNDFSGTDSTSVFFLNTFNGGVVTIEDFNIVNSKLGYRQGLHFVSSGSGNFRITGSSFRNVTLNTDASLIKTGLISSYMVDDMAFTGISQASANDNTNSMINLGTLNLNTTDNFTIKNIVVSQSSIALFVLGSITNSEQTGKLINFSNITYSDSLFDFSQDLIVFGSLETTSDFQMILSSVNMFNLSFTQTGNLIKFQHQSSMPLLMSDSTFTDIYGGSIYLESANLLNTGLKTHVRMINITVSNMNGGTNSVIRSKEGGLLNVSDSSFIQVSNNEGGAVINANAQNSIAEFYNCTFVNNTAMFGGVANVQDGSVIRFYDSLLANNFALQAGVIESQSDGYFEMHRCTIVNNYALVLPVAEILIVSRASIISNSTIHSNTAYDKDEIVRQIST